MSLESTDGRLTRTAGVAAAPAAHLETKRFDDSHSQRPVHPYPGMPELSRFNPLPAILAHDAFHQGQSGWMDLMNNFVLEGHRPRPSMVTKHEFGPVMLSNANFGYAGTHGGMSGTYVLKLATKAEANPYEGPPAPGGLSHAIKRLTTFRPAGRLQFEMWFSYTAEQDRAGTGESAVRAFGVLFDLQDEQYRYFPGVRYVNFADDEQIRRWQLMQAADVTDAEWAYGREGDWCKRGVDPVWFGRRYADGSGDAFQWVPNGEQLLCYNESPDKINWMYLRFQVDTATREYVELQVGPKVYDLRGTRPTYVAPYKGITGLVNPVVWIESNQQRRVFLYVDSILISCD
ncbi:DUF6772 family protein [Aeoliella sp.]|uniref:DUF6772 family protein n=1 Tax=Aeoliella sp. TaxID=2795800 RepID=UPI003CCC254D